LLPLVFIIFVIPNMCREKEPPFALHKVDVRLPLGNGMQAFFSNHLGQVAKVPDFPGRRVEGEHLPADFDGRGTEHVVDTPITRIVTGIVVFGALRKTRIVHVLEELLPRKDQRPRWWPAARKPVSGMRAEIRQPSSAREQLDTPSCDRALAAFFLLNFHAFCISNRAGIARLGPQFEGRHCTTRLWNHRNAR
jgi:hypothetical protein